MYLLLQPAEAIPPFIRFKVEHISVFLSQDLLHNSDPLPGFTFLGPVCILFCALPGALLGFGTGALLKLIRRHGL